MEKLDKIEQVVKTDLSWLRVHERLLLGTFLLASVLYLGNRWINKSAMDAQLNQAAVAQQLADAKQANEQLAALVAQQSAQYAQDRLERQREINALIVSMASRDAASGKKIEEVSKPKTATEALTDLRESYNNALPVDVTAVQANGQIAFPVPVVQTFTVTKIERDTAVADLNDQKIINQKQSDQMAQADTLIKSFGTQIDGLNNQMILQGKKCDADIAVVKADARKSKVKWFKLGFITGFISGLWVGHQI